MFKVKISFEKKIVIQKNLEEVKKIMLNFNQMSMWSPWACVDPEVKLTTLGNAGEVGHSQTWDGDMIGSGKMTLANISHDIAVLSLEFFKPFKNKSSSTYRLKSVNTATEVTWTMDMSLPIFFVFFKKMMTTFLGMDYERGLRKLKEYCETGTVESKLVNHHVQNVEAYHYIGFDGSCLCSEIGTSMPVTFGKLMKAINDKTIPTPDFVLASYHKFNPVTGECDYTAAAAYRNSVNVVPGMSTGFVPAHKSIKVTHVGKYNHLGNAWSMASCEQRSKKIKLNKKINMCEVYVNNPQGTPTAELVTDIYLAVK